MSALPAILMLTVQLGVGQAPAPEPPPGDGVVAPAEEVAPAEGPDPSDGSVPAEEPAPRGPALVPTIEGTTELPPAPAHPCTAADVWSVRMAGCGPACEAVDMRVGFLTLTDIKEGERLDREAIALAERRLLATGFFRQAQLSCERKPDGVAVLVQVTPNTFVRNVSVEGNQYFREKEISKRVTIHAGDVLNVEPGAEEADESVQRLLDSLRTMYRRAGLEDVGIAVESERVDDYTLDLTIVISEGDRERVRAVDFEHVQTELPPAGGISCPSVSRQRLAQLVELSVGDVVTTRDERGIKTRVRKWFQSIGYERPSVAVETAGDPLTLKVRVETQRCWLLRVWEREAASLGSNRAEPAFRFRDPIGLGAAERANDADYQRVSLEDWREALPFAESGVFDLEEARRAVESVQRTLAQRGLLFAEVSMEHRRLRDYRPQHSEGPVQGTVDIYITKNYARRLQGLEFLGRTAFTHEELIALMDVQVYAFFGAQGHVGVEQLLFDLTKIKRHYTSRGFYDFEYGIRGEDGQLTPRRVQHVEGEWLVWEYRYRDRGFRVKKRISEMVVYVEVPFVEGPRSVTRSVEVVGSRALAPAELRRLFGLAPSRPYGTHFLEQGKKAVLDWYRARGYHRASLVPLCEASDPEPVDGLCDPERVRSSKVDVVLRVDEGPRSVVGEVFWRGNFKTQPHVLTRDLPAPGEPYNEAVIAEAVRRLRNLGGYNSVQVEKIGLDEEPPRDRVALVVVVEEATSRFIDLALSVGSIDRESDRGTKAPAFIGSIMGQLVSNTDRSTSGLARPFSLSLPDVLFKFEGEYLEYNFLGLGWQFRVPLKYGFSTTNALRLGSLGVRLSIPRVGIPQGRLDLEVFAEIDRVTDQLDRTEFGISTLWTLPFTPRLSLGLGLDLGLVCFQNPGGTLAVDRKEFCTRFSAEEFGPQVRPLVRLRWDKQDNPLNPTRGFVISATAKYILGRDKDLVEKGAATTLVNFFKWELSAELAVDTTLGPILAFYARYGDSQPFSSASQDIFLPPNEIFTLGGSNGMRGFADHAVGRYIAGGQLSADIIDIQDDGGGNAILNGSAEVRVPLLRDFGLWGATFFDFGALAQSRTELFRDYAFRFSSGFGLRYLIGGQIPIRADVGFVLGKLRCSQWEDSTAKACGVMEDRWRLHFDLLYPF